MSLEIRRLQTEITELKKKIFAQMAEIEKFKKRSYSRICANCGCPCV